MPIEDKAPSESPFEWIGGEGRVRALVDRFYDLMDLESAYVDLRAAHGPELANARERLFMFLCGWLGGPDYYIEKHGHPRLQPADDRVPAQAETHIGVGLPGAKLAPLHTRKWAFISRLRKRLGVAPNSQPVTKPDDFWAIRARRSSGR